MPSIDVVTSYLLALVPAVTALMGIIAAVAIGIKKIKNSNDETVEKVTENDRLLKKQLIEVQAENIELKKTLNLLLKQQAKVHTKKEK